MMKKSMICVIVATAIMGLLTGCGEGANVNINIYNAGEKEAEETVAEEAVAEDTDTEETADEGEAENTVDIRIGTTGYVLTIPDDYHMAEVTEQERRDDMIAYYKSDERLMDFDVYQFPKDDMSLEEYAAKESKEYGADDYDMLSINDIELARYYSEEEYDGKSYRVVNYLFEAGDDFGELAFWLDGDDAEDLADRMIATLNKENEMTKILTEDYMQEFAAMLDEAIKNTDLTLDKKDSSEDVNEVEGGLFITKDGVECRSIKIGNMGSFFTFGEELYNETDEDKTFDPTKFVLETDSGELVFPCLISRDVNEVRAETKRLWMSYTIYDPKDIEGGSEVSVYYDGVFITKVTVEEK